MTQRGFDIVLGYIQDKLLQISCLFLREPNALTIIPHPKYNNSTFCIGETRKVLAKFRGGLSLTAGEPYFIPFEDDFFKFNKRILSRKDFSQEIILMYRT